MLLKNTSEMIESSINTTVSNSEYKFLSRELNKLEKRVFIVSIII